MRFAAAVSRQSRPAAAAQEVIRDVRARLGDGGAVDLATLFVTWELGMHAEEIAAAVREALAPDVLIGCTAESVLGAGQEVERAPGVSLLAARLPGVAITPIRLGGDAWMGARELTPETEPWMGADTRALLVLGDPFSTPTEEALSAWNQLRPGVPVFGGMASAATEPGGNVLLLNEGAFPDGLVGVGLSGAIRVEPVVSQGCRPAGPPLRVTGADGHVLRTLRFRPALEMAQSVLNELPPDEQALLENGLYVGVVTDEYKAEFGRGDFLVRNLVGADEATGALVIADEVRPGQTIQFHLRDGASADEDLRVLLSQRLHDENSTPPAGALLFSCNGRGTRLFDAPDHDVRAVENAAPGLPVAGFFAAGEIGPVGPRSFLHGHTASIALFYPG